MNRSDIHSAIAKNEGVSFKEGEQVLLLTLTHYVTGKVEAVTTCGPTSFLHLSQSAWIAETGRWNEALTKGEFSEVEPSPGEARINVALVVAAYPWDHPLPTKVK